MSQTTSADNFPLTPRIERPLTPIVQAQSMPLTPRPSTEKPQSLPRSRSNSHTSGKSGISNVSRMKKGEEVSSGVVFIGMDENDTTTVGRTTTESKRSSSSNTSQHHPSETNDTDHDDSDDNDHENTKQIAKHETPISSRRSKSSSTAGGRPNIPVLIDRRRSTSTSSTDSNGTASPSLRQRSVESSSRAKRKHTPHPSDPPETTPTATVEDEVDVLRRHSATEFQKFRDQLHSIPSNPALRTNTEDQLHPNPHHPKTKTEILRIERIYTPIALPGKHSVSDVTNYDVLIPRFSPSYPLLLRDYGINEGEWNGFITRVNRSCMEAFDPFRWSNIVVNVIAMLSFWISEWFMPNLTKRKLMDLEKYIDEINRGPWREKGVQIISLRRTAYLNIDIELQTSLLHESENTHPTDNVQDVVISKHTRTTSNSISPGMSLNTSTASNPNSPSILQGGSRTRSGTGVNSRTSLVDRYNGTGAV